jgi:hypothetical protein
MHIIEMNYLRQAQKEGGKKMWSTLAERRPNNHCNWTVLGMSSPPEDAEVRRV